MASDAPGRPRRLRRDRRVQGGRGVPATRRRRRPRRAGAHRRRAALRRRAHVLRARVRAGAHVAVRRPRADPAHPARPDRRPRRRRARDREAARQVRGRHLRRPPDRDAARDPRAGARVPGDAHRDVGARRGAGEPRDAARGAACTCSSPRRAASPAATSARAGSPIPTASRPRVLELLAAPTGALAGRTVLVTAGGTREPIDPVRFVGNRSSGKMGHAIADVAAPRGARTSCSSPPPTGRSPPASRSCGSRPPRRCTTRCIGRADGADAVVMAAAVADFRPKAVAPHEDQEGRRRARDRARADHRHPRRRSARASAPGQVVVGFAAETERRARATRRPSSRPSRST